MKKARFIAEYRPFEGDHKVCRTLSASNIFEAVDELLCSDAIDFEGSVIVDLNEGKVYSLIPLIFLQSDFRELCESFPVGMARVAEISTWN